MKLKFVKQGILILLLTFLLLISSTQSYDFFYSQPSQNVYLGSRSATAIVIADDQSMVVIGFNNSMVQSFTMQGVPLRNFTGFSNPITQIKWIQGAGPLIIDNQGNIKIFSSQTGNLLAGLQIPYGNYGSSTQITSLNGNFYLGFVYTSVSGQTVQSEIVEYVFNVNNNSLSYSKTYNIPSMQYPNFYVLNYADYSEGYQLLYVGNVNNGTVNVFNCSTGSLISISTINTSGVESNLGPNVYAGNIYQYGTNNYLWFQNYNKTQGSQTHFVSVFNGNTLTFQPVVSFNIGTGWAICPSSLYFVLGSPTSSVVNVYSTFSDFLQQLQGINGSSTMLQCSQNYLVSLAGNNSLVFYQMVPTPSSGTVFKFDTFQVIIISIIGVSFFVGLVSIIVFTICKKRKQQFLLDKSNSNQQAKKAKKFINRLKTLYNKSWQFTYLIIFTLANILDLVWSSQIGEITYALIPLVLVSIALLIKLILLCGKVSFKEFINMQLQFISPYVLTVINVILVVQIGVSFNFNPQSIQYFEDFKPNLSQYFLLQGIQYLIVTVICSLVMNRKSISKTQFYLLLLNIILQAAGSLVMTIYYIQNINESSDNMKDAINQAMQSLYENNLSVDQYDSIYKALTSNISAFETAKDYALASLASIIAVLIILIDMIGRPFEKQEQSEQIMQKFIQHSKNPSKKGQSSSQQIENSNQKNQQTELSSVKDKKYEKIEINASERRSSRD